MGINLRGSAIILLLIPFFVACGGESGMDSNGKKKPSADVFAAMVDEEDTGTIDVVFTIRLSETTSNDVTVDVATRDGSASAAQGDYVSVPLTTLTIPAKQREVEVVVTVNHDNEVETDESFDLELSNISSNAKLRVGTATATIINDDFPIVSIAPSEVVEGNAGTSELAFTVSMDVQAIGDVTVRYDTSNITALAGSDYTAANDILTIPEGSLSEEIVVNVHGDLSPESDETLVIALSDLSINARMGTDSAFGTIRNDEGPAVSIGDAAVDEGNSGTRELLFRVVLSLPTTGDVTVFYETADAGSATANDDYTPITSGSLSIAEGDVEAFLSVIVSGDTALETDEFFLVNLTGLTGAAELSSSASSANGTIRDDDTLASGTPQVSVASSIVTEGAEGSTTQLVFDVRVEPVDDSFPILIDYATEEVSSGASADVDYVSVPGSLLSIPAGASNASLTVTVNGDDVIEADEALSLVLNNLSPTAILTTPVVTGLIVDDDDPAATLPRVNISHASLAEGNDGTSEMAFLVSLTEEATSAVSVTAETRDRLFSPEAIAGSDYIETSETVIIAQGSRSTLFQVPIFGDLITENDEVFEVTLRDVIGNATLANSVAIGTIATDDPFSFVTISNEGAAEGDLGDDERLVFTVAFAAQSELDVTFDFETVSGTAIADEDFVNIPPTPLTIAAGETSATIEVSLIGDDDNEIDEQFTVVLTNLSQNAEFEKSVGSGSISNDDNGVGWGLPQPLDPQREYSESARPQLAMNANGDAIAVWFQPRGSFGPTPANPSARYTPGAGWGPVEGPPGLARTSAIDFSIGIDGNGESTLLRSTGGLVTERHVPGLGWNMLTDQDEDLRATYPDIGTFFDTQRVATNAAGHVIALSQATIFGPIRRTSVFNYYDPMLGWGTTDLFSPQEEGFGSIQVAMDGSGRAIVVLSDREIAKHFDPLTAQWTDSPPLTLETSPGNFERMRSPRISMNAAGDAVVVWQRAGNLDVMANRFDRTRGMWKDPVLIHVAGGSIGEENPNVVIDPAGNAFAIWMEEDSADPSNGYHIYSRYYDAATDHWDANQQTVAEPGLARRRIVAGSANITILNDFDVPAVGIDASGIPFVAWSQDIEDDDDFTIRASRYDGLGWGAPDNLSDDLEGDASMVSIRVDAAGNAIAVWQQRDPLDSEFRVWSNRFTAPAP